ncbi:hypothetical protein HELRODRAFT_68680, partial [Helobdella robusta]|uniref:HECT-type E3 ubiquitin transferase n=1 Tax=Helobdella robusta TaxID=6412 RepID=T1FZI2_HELRO
REDVQTCKQQKRWTELTNYFAIVFDNSSNLNANFKKTDDEYEGDTKRRLEINFSKVYSVYDLLVTLPIEVQKVTLRAILNNLLRDRRLQSKDEIKAYIILLLNPQFNHRNTYTIFAHLLRQISVLKDVQHHYLVHTFKNIAQEKFREMVKRIQRFISARLSLSNSKDDDLPPKSKCLWWIPSATKILALLNAASNLATPQLMNYQEFYNPSLDHLDLLVEYYNWQCSTGPNCFSFCQYPFILSLAAKRTILQKDSEQQMVVMARKSLVAKVQQHQVPEIGMLFLNLTIRRSHLVSDSLNEIARKQMELKKKLKVTFAGEPGLDMGGLTKEWFLLLTRQIFQADFGMFTYDPVARVYWFSCAPCDNLQEFNLVGALMGLAVYNSVQLDIRFPPIVYKKLLSPAVVPPNVQKAVVGVTKATLSDLKLVYPDLTNGLQELLNYGGNVEEDMGATFQISHNVFGTTTTYDLKPGGADIAVTAENRDEYVQLYIDYLLNQSIYRQFQAFYHGFHSVCASNALILLRPEEIELLVCGSPALDMNDLMKVTVYDGYNSESETVKYFWEVVTSLSGDVQKQLLLFATGSDRVPVGGMQEMHFKITRVENVNMLPVSHTCFNQLVLPAYKSKKVLKQKLLVAIENAEGFGLE